MKPLQVGEIRINADDFGWLDGQNLAVEKAYRFGILKSASIMTTTPGFAEAARIAGENPGLRIGIHLTINESEPLTPPEFLPNLARDDGRFHDTIRSLVRLWAAGKLKKAEVLPEWRAQIDRALAAGIRITHLDSHKHVHLFPPFFEAAIELAHAYDIPTVRVPLERFGAESLRRAPFLLPLGLLARRAHWQLERSSLGAPSRFIGFTWSGQMTRPRLDAAIASFRPGETLEIMVHPALRTEAVRELQRRYRWAKAYLFEEEMDALIRLRGDLKMEDIADEPAAER